MTQEYKELILKDLCARLPYGVKCQWDTYYEGILIDVCKCKTKDGFVYWDCYFEECGDDVPIEIVKPYLRPMSSMTEEERKEVGNLIKENRPDPYGIISNKGIYNLLFSVSITSGVLIDWLNAYHFDYRGLIEKGLALEAQEGMYK